MYIVTGGAGFIGNAFVWKLNQEGIDDILIVDSLGCSEKWKNLVKRRYADFIHKDAFYEMLCEGSLPFKAKAVIHMGIMHDPREARSEAGKGAVFTICLPAAETVEDENLT